MAPRSQWDALAEPLIGEKRKKSCNASIAGYLLLYLASGVSQPLLMSEIRRAGMGDVQCQVYMMPYYLGMASTGLLTVCRSEKVSWRSLPLHRCAFIALFGITAQSLNWSGNMLAGSSIFAVVYASVTIWSAVLSRLLLQRVLTPLQWSGILTVFSGLAITGFAAKSTGGMVFLGTCMICLGTFLHAMCHVLSELVSVRGERIPPQINACVQGLTACTLVGTWQCAYTATHWERIAGPVSEADSSWWFCLALLLAIAVGNFVHAASFFQLLTRIGAVSTGVVKAVQGVAVFSLSHVLYCQRDESQCFTPLKGLSLVIVVLGVLLYVLATASAQERQSVRSKDADV
ncbi:unnamed protein product [Polarella glacialis]|uniref:Sugar phosphate transporter domain-containing protein n=1 Tax=Polarella glacialis TaxID=89957 RepID=A0A813EDN9_POLGL|nr:unnamed protein product [Polarella glacialis]